MQKEVNYFRGTGGGGGGYGKRRKGELGLRYMVSDGRRGLRFMVSEGRGIKVYGK